MNFLEFTGAPFKKASPVYVVAAKDGWFHRKARLFVARELGRLWGTEPEARAVDLRELPRGEARKEALGRALSGLYAGDFFSGATLLVVHAGTFLKEEGKLLVPLIDAPPDRAAVLVLAESASSPPGLAVDAGTPYETPPFWREEIPRWQNDLAQWVSRLAREEHGKKMSLPAAQELVDLSGNALQTLAADLENLALYIGDVSEIRKEDVSALLGARRVPTPSLLEEALLKKDFPAALAAARACFERGVERWPDRKVETNPSGISLLLSATVTRVLADLGKAAESPESAAKLFPSSKRKAFLYDKAIRAGVHRSLPAWLPLWSRLDRRLKRGDGPPQVRIETALARMART